MVNNRNDIITFLQTHKDEMAQRFGVVSIGLFGSYARGDAREDSDIDIAIEIMPEKNPWGISSESDAISSSSSAKPLTWG